MTHYAIHESAAAHSDALTQYQASLIVRREARAALADAERKVAMAQQKLSTAASTFGRLVGETGENE